MKYVIIAPLTRALRGVTILVHFEQYVWSHLMNCQSVNDLLQLAHVVENAVNPMLPRSPSRQDPNDWDDSHYPDEPFFERDRIAECGHAWESCVLGGRTYFWGDAEFPYGLVMAKWPDLEFRSELPTRAKPKRWSTVYFLSVEYIQALFTDKFGRTRGSVGMVLEKSNSRRRTVGGNTIREM